MASKRVSQNEGVVSGAVPARHKPATTRRSRVAVEPAQPVAATPVEAPEQFTREEIARLAYSYWEARGYRGGSPDEDWVRAERELSSAVTASQPSATGAQLSTGAAGR